MNSSSQILAEIGMIFLGLVLSFIIFGLALKPDFSGKRAVLITDGGQAAEDTLALLPFNSQYTPLDAIPDSAKVETTTDNSEGTIKFDAAENLFFNFHPRLALWIFSFCMLIAVSFGFILPVVQYIHAFRRQFEIKKPVMVKSAVLAGAFIILSSLVALGAELQLFQKGDLMLAYVSAMHEFDMLINHPKETASVLMGLASLSSLLAITGFFIIIFVLDKLDEYTDKNILAQKFKRLGESMNFFLFVLAISITGTVITTSFLREALLEALPPSLHFLFPLEFVHLYGLTYTVFLAVIYLPVYFQLRRKGTAILQTQSFSETGRKEGGEPSEKDVSYKDIFMLKTSSVDTFKIILSLLAPALSSLLSNAVGV